ncbi:phosphopantetheine-binding protein, partial [Massilia sp.]|uniref:phosphopantetheine-binding protein n=1 Tax=Massilia sp. TaxID=1882437 RepID=UPI00352BED00
GLPAGQIGSTANFFELGGNSLMVIRLLAAVNAAWSLELTVTAIYKYHTIEALAGLIDEFMGQLAASERIAALPDDDLVEIDL